MIKKNLKKEEKKLIMRKSKKIVLLIHGCFRCCSFHGNEIERHSIQYHIRHLSS